MVLKGIFLPGFSAVKDHNWQPKTRFLVKYWYIFDLERVIVYNIGAQKSRFNILFQNILKLFKEYLGIVFDFQRPTSMGIYSSKARKFIPKVEIFCQFKCFPKRHPQDSITLPALKTARGILNSKFAIYYFSCHNHF